MRIFWQLLCREGRQAAADPRRLLFLFGAALAYLAVFGMLYRPNLVREVPTVLYDAAQTRQSREVLRGFADSDSFRVVGYPASEEEMRRSLREKEAFVAIEVPEDFSRRIAKEGAAEVLYMVNGSNIIMTNVTSFAAQEILADCSARWGARRAALALGLDEDALRQRAAPVSLRLRVLANPTQGYVFFFLIGLAMAAFQQGILFAMGAAVLQEAERPEEGICYGRMMLAKGVFYWLLSLGSFALVLGVMAGLLGIPFRAPLWRLAALGGAYAFAVLGFCALAASFFAREASYVRAAILYPVPAFILSGYTWPLESMGPAMQLLAKCFPLTYLSSNVRALLLAGHAPHYGKSILLLLLLGILCWTLLAAKRRRVRPFL